MCVEGDGEGDEEEGPDRTLRYTPQGGALRAIGVWGLLLSFKKEKHNRLSLRLVVNCTKYVNRSYGSIRLPRAITHHERTHPDRPECRVLSEVEGRGVSRGTIGFFVLQAAPVPALSRRCTEAAL